MTQDWLYLDEEQASPVKSRDRLYWESHDGYVATQSSRKKRKIVPLSQVKKKSSLDGEKEHDTEVSQT